MNGEGGDTGAAVVGDVVSLDETPGPLLNHDAPAAGVDAAPGANRGDGGRSGCIQAPPGGGGDRANTTSTRV